MFYVRTSDDGPSRVAVTPFRLDPAAVFPNRVFRRKTGIHCWLVEETEESELAPADLPAAEPAKVASVKSESAATPPVADSGGLVTIAPVTAESACSPVIGQLPSRDPESRDRAAASGTAASSGCNRPSPVVDSGVVQAGSADTRGDRVGHVGLGIFARCAKRARRE